MMTKPIQWNFDRTSRVEVDHQLSHYINQLTREGIRIITVVPVRYETFSYGMWASKQDIKLVSAIIIVVDDKTISK